MNPGEAALRHLLAPIERPLADPNTTDIVIQKPGEVAIEQHNKWHWIEVPEFTFQRLDAIAIHAGNLLSKDFDISHPVVETTLPGRQRFTAVRPAITLPGTIAIAIRKPMAEASFDDDFDFSHDLEAAREHTAVVHPADDELLHLYRSNAWKRFFPLAVQASKNIAAVGAQASGKTTFIRRTMRKLPTERRLITVEDTEEFLDLVIDETGLPLRNRVSFIYGAAGITPGSLIMTALRMRADGVAIQEMRPGDGAAMAYYRMHKAGTTGSFATWHAEHNDAFGPLALMIRSTPEGRTIPDLDDVLRNMIDIVTFHRRSPTGAFLPPSIYFRLAHQCPQPASRPTYSLPSSSRSSGSLALITSGT